VGTILQSGSGYASNTDYNNIPIPNLCGDEFTFTIYDSYGDGIIPPRGYTFYVNDIAIKSGDSFGSVDMFKFNANGLIIYECLPAAPKFPIELRLTTDNYGGETSWEVHESSTGVLIANGSGYSSSQTYTITEQLCYGEFTFTIKDSWGDGICCGYGEGGYEFLVNEIQIKSGGDFGSSETVNFNQDGAVNGASASQTTCDDDLSFSIVVKGVRYTCADVKENAKLCAECQGNKCLTDACCGCKSSE